jgi:3-isopropylmalate/(R)-2-methylmalate dehydratase small subunit
MQGFTRVTGAAAPMPAAHVDTDVIMPKQFLKGIDRANLDRGVFFDLRFDAQGNETPDFILNQAGWEDLRFLVVGPNFGCGSSREHAVWGLQQIGVRALIGTNFAGIFNDNCQRNGVLTVSLPAEQVAVLMACATDAARNRLTLDLPGQRITTDYNGQHTDFAIDGRRKDALIRGLDPIGVTLEDAAAIRAFEDGRRAQYRWL